VISAGFFAFYAKRFLRSRTDMENLRISNEFAEMDLQLIHRFLANESYWARGIELKAVSKGLANSLCFGAFIGNDQVAFGRVVTDFSSFGYLRDIFVLSQFRGRGYGKALVRSMLARLDEEGVATLMLATQDAHPLYRGFGFELLEGSTKVMRRALRSPVP
jgi:GNAT superfamily N-acetyltransferase